MSFDIDQYNWTIVRALFFYKSTSFFAIVPNNITSYTALFLTNKKSYIFFLRRGIVNWITMTRNLIHKKKSILSLFATN